MALAIFEKLRSSRRLKAEQKTQTWEQLTQRVADELADEAEIEAALEALGKTEDELQDAVVFILKTHDNRVLASELPALNAASAAIEAAQQRLNAEFAEKLNALRKAHHDETQVLYFQQRSVIQKISAGDDAACWLSQNIPEDVKRRAAVMYDKISQRQAEITKIRGNAGMLRGSGYSSMLPDTRVPDQQRIAALEKEIAELSKQASAIESGSGR